MRHGPHTHGCYRSGDVVRRVREASAIPITPVDFDSWVGGSIVRSQSDLFKFPARP